MFNPCLSSTLLTDGLSEATRQREPCEQGWRHGAAGAAVCVPDVPPHPAGPARSGFTPKAQKQRGMWVNPRGRNRQLGLAGAWEGDTRPSPQGLELPLSL